MIKLTSDTPVDTVAYEEHLTDRGYIYINKERMRRILDYNRSRERTYKELACLCMGTTSGGKYNQLYDEAIRDYLIEFNGCLPARFENRKNARGWGLDMKKVLEPLLSYGYAKDFLGYYMKYQSYKSKNGFMESLIRDCSPSDEVDRDDNPLSKVRFNVNRRANMRYYYKETAIVSISEIYNPGLSVPDGKVLVSGDFKQSDFRIAYNLFIRNESNAVTMDKYEDKYEGFCRLLAEDEGKSFDEDDFKKNRGIYKALVLGPIYGKQSDAGKEGKAFVESVKRYLNKCPRYMQYCNNLDTRIDMNVPILLTSYFGSIEVRNTTRNRVDDKNFCLNSPVQSTTSELVIILVNQILDKFYAMGYTKDNIDVYYVRHDEPIFIMDEELMKDCWVFKEYSDILVDNWTPIGMDFSYGYTYGSEDKDLMKVAQMVYDTNRDKITKLELDTSSNYTYSPVDKSFSCECSINKVKDDEFILVFYDRFSDKCCYRLLKNCIAEQVDDRIKQELANMVPALRDMGYKGICCLSTFLQSLYLVDGVMITCKVTDFNETSRARMLARVMAKKYCDKYDLPNKLEIAQYEYDFAYKVGDLGLD